MQKPSACPTQRVAPVTAPELLRLRQSFGLSTMPKHAQRFVRQKAGDALYLIAWLGDAPLGHGLLKWQGSTDAPVAAHLRTSQQIPCPDLEDLFVIPDQRGRGVGSHILQAAEERVAERGFAQLGLSVGIDNDDARRLYARRGYRDAGVGVYLEQGVYLDEAGQRRRWKEHCVYLIKPLGSQEHLSIEGVKE